MLGHGIHKICVELGELEVEEDGKLYYGQKGHLGDCIVNVDGTLCSEMCITMLIATKMNKTARMSMFFDMCRTEDKVICYYIKKFFKNAF